MHKSPEQWLEEALPKNKGGVFKLFLGYAPGVGKTYNMLSEALRRHSRGEDVVIGVVETHGRKAIEELASKLETLPRKKIDYKGAMFEEMDVDAILARKPHVVLVRCPGDFVSTDSPPRIGIGPAEWSRGLGVGANVF